MANLGGKGKRSGVWKFFTLDADNEVPNTHAKCNACNDMVGRGGTNPRNFSTTNLVNHIRRHHPEQHIQYVKEQSDSKSQQRQQQMPTTSTQPTVIEAFTAKTKWPGTSKEATKYNELIGMMIAIDNQPYSFVEDQGFKNLMAQALPKYKIPGK